MAAFSLCSAHREGHVSRLLTEHVFLFLVNHQFLSMHSCAHQHEVIRCFWVTLERAQGGMVGQQTTQSLKESQLVFFGLRDHLWLKGPVLGARAKAKAGLASAKK